MQGEQGQPLVVDGACRAGFALVPEQGTVVLIEKWLAHLLLEGTLIVVGRLGQITIFVGLDS